jgi:serine/threonine-protein kinase SRPK3
MTTNTSTPLQHEPRTFPTSGFDVIDASEEVEEETLSGYCPKKYYPVRLGEIFERRYQVVGKLGYGTTSTVWLAHDLLSVITILMGWMQMPKQRFLLTTYSPRQSRYVTLKIYVSGSSRTRELEIYDHLNRMEETPDHPGKKCIRKLFGSFQVDGPNGNHLCLIHEPLGLSLAQIAEVCRGRKFSLEVLKPCLRQILIAVDFLHAKAGIIHTGIGAFLA